MLETVDLSKRLEKPDYQKLLLRHQIRLRKLTFDLYRQKRGVVVVLEGWDASGKGGSIRRITEKLDPRGYHVYSIGAPTGEDRMHHYLWRFWRRLLAPEDKQLVVFDRSWYGRVLVERVEGLASETEWRKAYHEINDFERQLNNADFLVVKFWIHISKDEQLRRFEGRRNTPHKAWKLTDEDWRNREKWDLYQEAVSDMLVKTSTLRAPWNIVEGNDKNFARVKAIETLVDQIGKALKVSSAGADEGD